MLENKRFSFTAGKETIIGEIFGEDTNELSDFIFFHGAGSGSRKRVKQYLDAALFEVVPNIVAFDFSGHGKSSGVLKQSSLKQRVLEARTAIDLYSTKKNLSMCGASMGGYVALKMLEHYDIKNLILFVPGIYHKDAFAMQFNQGFTDLIRQPESWKETDIITSLQKFEGNIIIIAGEKDTVIPRGVIELIYSSACNASHREVMWLKESTHAMADFLENNPIERESVAQKIEELITEQS